MIRVMAANNQQTEIELVANENLTNDPGDVPEYLKPSKSPQIAVSGGVPITAIECQIIDTAAFQRLRGIRQLGSLIWFIPLLFTHASTIHSAYSTSQRKWLRRFDKTLTAAWKSGRLRTSKSR
jgi:hypothetical protein